MRLRVIGFKPKRGFKLFDRLRRLPLFLQGHAVCKQLVRPLRLSKAQIAAADRAIGRNPQRRFIFRDCVLKVTSLGERAREIAPRFDRFRLNL